MKAKKKLPFIDKLFLWINFFLCVLLLISYLAPITDPAKFWPVAFFGLAYTPLLSWFFTGWCAAGRFSYYH
jgi:hypothetical protein